MNDQIKELAEQSEGSTICECGASGFNYEKFAELIVKECMELCRKQSLHYAEHNNQGAASSAADVCRILIKSHFGVE